MAGLHRLLAEVDELAMADAVVVIAGMEGALASVVGGLTPAPVVAVPTSTGYGAAFEGLTALLAMLAACASGVTVVGHRQRLRRRLCHRPAAPVSGPTTAPHPPTATAAATPPTATVAWFHCFAGIAGDMALGSLIDAGADVEEIRLLLHRLVPARLGARRSRSRSGVAWPAPGPWWQGATAIPSPAPMRTSSG